MRADQDPQRRTFPPDHREEVAYSAVQTLLFPGPCHISRDRGPGGGFFIPLPLLSEDFRGPEVSGPRECSESWKALFRHGGSFTSAWYFASISKPVLLIVMLLTKVHTFFRS